MIILEILIGTVLLLLGRKVFWLFVAGVGFVTAITLAGPFLQDQPDWLTLVVALVTGVIGALLAIIVQRMAAGLAGFLAGGYLVLSLLELLSVELGDMSWWLALAGGVVGVILAAVLLDWALMILSSLSGAVLIVEAFDFMGTMAVVVSAILFVVGMIVQAGILRQEQEKSSASFNGE
jgi:hypothetical protein